MIEHGESFREGFSNHLPPCRWGRFGWSDWRCRLRRETCNVSMLATRGWWWGHRPRSEIRLRSRWKKRLLVISGGGRRETKIFLVFGGGRWTVNGFLLAHLVHDIDAVKGRKNISSRLGFVFSLTFILIICHTIICKCCPCTVLSNKTLKLLLKLN